MDREDFKKPMEERWGPRRRDAEKGRIWVGVFLLIIGGLFLARQSGVPFPAWFFTWPMILIAFGLLSAIKHRFRGIGWLFPLAIGGIFLFDKMSPDINLRPYIWPIILIAAGLFIIFRPKGRHCGGGRNDDSSLQQNDANAVATTADNSWEKGMNDGNDVIDIVAIFGGVKKNMLSKSFKGGDVVAFMGGAEINLTQADFNGRIKVDCFNMFGGTKLIIPADWEVQSDVVAIFGGVDDKRPPSPNPAPNKVLYLDGTCLFGGLEIKSY